MSSIIRAFLLALLMLGIFLVSASAHADPPRDRYIVVLEDEAGTPQQVAAEVAQRVNDRVGYVYENALHGFSITMPCGAFARVNRDPHIAYIDYIQTGMRLIGYSTSGSRFWLSPEESGKIRVNQFSAGKKGVGHCQGDNFTLMITIGMLRRFAAGQWSPQEIALLHGNEQYLGDMEALADAEIVTDQCHSSFTLPVSLLHQPIAER